MSLQKQTKSIKCQHFKIENGKLIKAKLPEQSQVNYKYIPYTPLNKPIQEDYFRATIDELLKENSKLKMEIQQGPVFKSTIKTESTYYRQSQKIHTQLEEINEKYRICQAQLQQQKALAGMREQQCKKLRAQNFKLHDTINDLVNELDKLKNKLAYSQFQAQRINKILEQYNETMKKITLAEKIISEDNQFSQALSRSQRKFGQQKMNQDKDEFFTIRANSQDGDYHQRFMTPRQGKDLQDQKFYPNRTAEQNKMEMSEVRSIRSQEHSFKNSYRKKSLGKSSEDRTSNCQSEISENLKNWHLWATPNSKFSTIDLLDDEKDPVSGSLSSIFFTK